MMALRVLLLLLLTDISQEIPVTEKPSLVGPELEGRITASTFVLKQPRCIFDVYTNHTDEIWLVVAFTSERSKFVNPAPPQSLPAYQDFPTNISYMTLNTARLNYPCQPDSNDITVLRVGSETSCMNDRSRPNCNGPLPAGGPYSVKFLAMDNSQPKAETEWLDDITLKTAQDPGTIDPRPRRRSASMIVITTILSILLAILLACFIAMLIYVCTDICGSSEIYNKESPMAVTRYNTHHVYSQPENRPAGDLNCPSSHPEPPPGSRTSQVLSSAWKTAAPPAAPL